MQDQLAFWNSYPKLKKQLIQVNNVIHQEIHRAHGIVGDALEDAFAVEGKLLRPALVLLFAQYDQCDKETLTKITNVAASIELLHNATLIHDDIVDESDVRRGKPSTQAKYSKKVAVYAGDFLFALSSRLLSDNARSMESLQIDGKVMQGILGGELGQLDSAYNTKITKERYLDQINGKTGLLFGLSCFLGAFEGGKSKMVANNALKFGELLGQAFQMKDDILDYTSTEADFKKPVLLDLKNGIYSGPLIFAMQNDESGDLERLISKGKDLTDDELLLAEKRVNELGGVKVANDMAVDLMDQAIKLINKSFAKFSTKETILEVSHVIVNRTY